TPVPQEPVGEKSLKQVAKGEQLPTSASEKNDENRQNVSGSSNSSSSSSDSGSSSS
ncbi:hypothetical protein ACJX0J_025232, partial [Zea mays]